MAEAYSHEVSSCGFWPGNGGYGRAAFYVYAYPEPAGYGDAKLATPKPSTTRISGNSFCHMTPCAKRAIPTRCCSAFCRKPMQAAADLAQWDRNALEDPRAISAGKFAPHQRRAVRHRLHLAEGDRARQVFHAAIRRHDHPIRRQRHRARAGCARPPVCGVSMAMSDRSITPRMMVFDGNSFKILRSSFGCAASMEICCAFEPSSSGRNE